jgi:hypothetical protein
MKLSGKIDSSKLALIGLFGIMAYNAFPYIGEATAVGTETAEGEIISAETPKLTYIEKGKQLISAIITRPLRRCINCKASWMI